MAKRSRKKAPRKKAGKVTVRSYKRTQGKLPPRDSRGRWRKKARRRSGSTSSQTSMF